MIIKYITFLVGIIWSYSIIKTQSVFSKKAGIIFKIFITKVSWLTLIAACYFGYKNFTLTFTNISAQSGNILLINSGGHTVSAHTNTKVDANILGTISTAGTYLLAYFSDGTNVYMTNSAVYT